jgi:hypothetical protein
MVLPLVPVFELPVAAATSGTTGDCTWTLDDTTLTITGNGAMKDYTINSRAPWGTTITKVIVENGVTSIGDFSFYNCKNITQVVIPDSLKTLGIWCFYNCNKLSTIEIPDQITTIANCAFAFCTKLTSIKLPNHVTSIEGGAFRDCSSLTSIEIPNSIHSIGGSAFSGCTKLTSIKLSKKITTIYSYTFSNCKALTDVWYEGNREDRSAISINSENEYLTNAIWHYDFCFQNPDANKVHIYDNACDTNCNLCGTTRSGAHTFDNVCDTVCNECGVSRTVNSHTYSNACDKLCNICFAERTVSSHVYDSVCDTSCNECSEERTAPHDSPVRGMDGDEHWLQCSVCNAIDEITRTDHIYDNAYDTICNICAYERLFAGGSGTETSPYLIETKEHLNNVRKDLDAHYKLIADIVFAETDFANGGVFYNSAKGWEPIGTEDDPFTGVFDGNGHSIKNLYIKNVGGGSVGLFGRNTGVIKNLSMINANIYARGQVGGPFRGTTVYAGTIAGVSLGSILNCYSSGSVYATAENAGSHTSDTNYSAYIYAGGIAGYTRGMVTNCYNTCSVTSYNPLRLDPYAGGIAGSSNGSITNSYNLGDISATYDGGIVGEQSDAGTISNCYYLDTISRGVGEGADAGKKCTLLTMAKQETYTDFDFDTVWTMGGNEDYPFPELVSVPMEYKRAIKSIAIETAPSKLTYIQDYESLDITGGTLGIACEYDKFYIIPLSETTLSGFDNTIAGKQKVTVTYEGFTTEFEVFITAKGDVDGVEGVDLDDAIYLLYHVNFSTTYPVNQPVDFNGDGKEDLDDAIYLLYHVNFKETYPLH